MINFYELYDLFLRTGNNFYENFLLAIMLLFIFLAIYIFLSSNKKKQEKQAKSKIIFLLLFLALTASAISLIFSNIGCKAEAEKQIENFKNQYDLKVDKKVFLEQTKKLEKFCKNYNKEKEYLKDNNFCNRNPNSNGKIDVDQFTFNQVFNEIYKNDFNKLKSEKNLKKSIDYIEQIN